MFWTAMILGFAGSLHCMGMCSPLAMAVTNLSPNMIVSRLLYNSGRIFTYGIFGSIVASIGAGLPLMRYQNLLSIVLGIALLVIGCAGISLLKIPFFTSAMGGMSLFVKKLFSKYLRTKSYASTFLLGSLNGFLPCGLSFLALTYTITLSGPVEGFVFMAMFGVGTLPVMLGFTSVLHWVVHKFHVSTQRLTTIMLVVSGALLIARVFIVHLPQSGSFADSVVDIVVCR
jgi:uncharacterized protein